nr:immunoglobulin lambda-1 light chain-like [Pelodiscus sinensis]|eukprot:XP_025043132.1 immunoglobulin lambda-1 light chain-like [Pelodiscus sinensis]
MRPLQGLLLLLCLAGGRCQYASFSQSPAEISVSPGGMATLECAVANVGADKVHMIWIRQSPGQKPEGVLSFLTDLKIYRAPGIPERFEPSRDAANKTFLLTIREVQAGDDSIYFCFAYYGSAGVQTWGEGTRVRVLRSDLPQPRMQLFPPAQEELATGAATLTCLVSGFFPGYVEVQWKREGQRQAQGVSTGPVALGPDQTYAVSSHLRVSAGEWHAGTRYSCLARHESLRSPLERSISAQACRPAQPHKEPLLPEPGQAPGPACGTTDMAMPSTVESRELLCASGSQASLLPTGSNKPWTESK